MIQDIYYQDVYLYIISLLVLLYTSQYFNIFLTEPSSLPYFKNRENIFSALAITIFMIIFIGFRPISDVFVDMPGYAEAMNNHNYEEEEISLFNNYIFVPMMAFLSSHGASEQTPIVILAIINFGVSFIAFRKFYPKDTYLAMLTYFGAFNTFGGATNGLKAGCASSIFLAALAFRENRIAFISLLIITLGFHHSMQLPIGATIACLYYKKTNTYMKFWVFCLIISLLKITYFQDLFGANLADVDEHGASYLTTYVGADYSTLGGKGGFRLDFILYSIIPIFVYYYFKDKKNFTDNIYTLLINTYILTNAIWLLCMYANYTNRIASLSWSLYPVIIIYPYIYHSNIWTIKREINLCLVAVLHLSFTLFMNFIYYSD